MEERFYVNRLGRKILYRVWKTDNTAATLHIYHGMAEHSLRYKGFAEYMNKLGFTVFCHDHMGHGGSLDGGLEGYFNDKDGWAHACQDALDIDEIIKKEYSNVPHFLFGHSMGSFMARTNIIDHNDLFAAAVICGTGGSQGAIGAIGKGLAAFRQAIFGAKHKDEMLNKMIFGAYNTKFKADGDFAWLSKDRKEVEAYIADPLCGFTCTSSFYKDLVGATIIANDLKKAERIRKDLPILLISGKNDPVGAFSKGVKSSAEMYRKAGIKDVRLSIIEDGRHEILNDDTKDETMRIVSDFYKEFIK